MIIKLLAAVVVFFLTIAGFNYVAPGVSELIKALVAFFFAYVAFKYAPPSV